MKPLMVMLMTVCVGFAYAEETPDQKQAVKVAENYLSVMGFSRVKLINQLVSFDGFTKEDATYAVDAVNADWKEQAVRVAKNYLSVMGFSRPKLVNQLISFDAFTKEQATYGVDQAYK
jgi:colicin import membrane protein